VRFCDTVLSTLLRGLGVVLQYPCHCNSSWSLFGRFRSRKASFSSDYAGFRAFAHPLSAIRGFSLLVGSAASASTLVRAPFQVRSGFHADFFRLQSPLGVFTGI